VQGRPLHVFETAISRASAVTLGVTAVSIVSVVFHRELSKEEAVGEKFVFHPQYRAALIGAFRTLVGVGLTGQFWVLTGAPTAAGVFLVTGIMCGLFSTHPRPHHASLSFGLAITASGAAAFICLYYFVQRMETFPLLIASMALFLLPGGMLMAFPRTAFFGLGFTVNFINQMLPLNEMHYDMVTFFNNLTTALAATAVTVLAFLLIFPKTSND